MKIINVKINEPIQSNEPLSACIGFFDGLHAGHQKLVEKVIEQNEYKRALITFDPDPAVILKNDASIRHIMSLEDKIEVAATLEIEVFIILETNRNLLSLSPERFVHDILVPLQIKHLVCGFDFHYGYKGAGNAQTLAQYSDLFELDVIEEVDYLQQKVSSSRIVAYLKEGHVTKAHHLLTRPYMVKGTVVAGHQKGREIGFPTANLKMDQEYHEVKQGVYVTEIFINHQWYPAITNVGHNLTFNTSEPLSIETYILDFNEFIYGKRVKLAFLKYLREEIKFDSVNDLIKQMEQDEKDAREFFQ